MAEEPFDITREFHNDCCLIAIALPLSWAGNNVWLENLACRTQITHGVFAFGIGALLFAFGCTLLTQTVKAAHIDPVQALKNE